MDDKALHALGLDANPRAGIDAVQDNARGDDEDDSLDRRIADRTLEGDDGEGLIIAIALGVLDARGDRRTRKQGA